MLRVLAAAALSCGAAALSTADPTLAIMQQRIQAQNVIPASKQPGFDGTVTDALALLNTSSMMFTDIRYGYQQSAIWPCYWHLWRAMTFAQAWQSPSSAYHGNASFLGTAMDVLDWWLVNAETVCPQSNWWWWTIGVPLALGPTVNVLNAQLAANQTAVAQAMLTKGNPHSYTDANLVWVCEGAVYAGVLVNNATLVQNCLDLSFATLVYTAGNAEGIKVDGAFNQHGAQIYNGGYGMSFAQGIAMFLSWTSGTPFGLNGTDPRLAAFTTLMADGSLRMMRYGAPPAGTIYASGVASSLWDIAVIGRDISRPWGSNWNNQAGPETTFTPATISGIGGPGAAQFSAFASMLAGTASPELTVNVTQGTRVYHSADYVLHNSGAGNYSAPNGVGWMASVRMASTRTLTCECINGENKRGLHLSDSPLWLYVQGMGYEYVDTMPLWDWMRLPGVTALPYAVPQGCGATSGRTAFAGGVADASAPGGGGIGSAVQDYVAGFGEGLSARKSFFFFPDLYVAAVANLTAAPARASLPAWTGVAQRRASGSGVFTSAAPGTPLAAGYNGTLPAGAWWVWEGGVGYVFPQGWASAGAAVHVSAVLTTGDWSDIGAETGAVNATMFMLWVEHAAPVAAASLAYMVVPNVQYAAFQAALPALMRPAAQGGVALVRNDAGVQAVRHGGAQALQASVFSLDGAAAGAVAVIDGGSGWNVTVDHEGAYVVRVGAKGGNGTLVVSAAEPAQPAAGWAVRVGIDRAVRAGNVPGVASATCLAGGDGASGAAGWAVQLSYAPVDGSTLTVPCALA